MILLFSVSSHVEQVIMQAVVGLDTSTDERGPKSPDCLPDFVLQVAERSEYLDAAARLMDYEYVHECYKYDRDVVFVVVKRERMQKPYLRTVCVTIYKMNMIHNQNLIDKSPHFPFMLNTFQAKDDTLDCDIKTEEVSPRDQMTTLSYHNLKILLG